MGRKPTPSPLGMDNNYGYGLALIIMSGIIVYYAWMMRLWGVIPVAIPALALISYWLYGRVLLLRCMRLPRRGIRGIIVYSNSPNWQTYIETDWLPLFGDRFIVLNRSRGDHRKGTLAARVYRHFCPQDENHCPAIILFRGLMHPYVYRCFHAFRDFKHGNPRALKELETHLLKQLTNR